CLGTGKQGILKANLQNVPASIGRLINARAYDGVSSEVYDEPPEGIKGSGKMLRRVALLGGELPHVKQLKDLPWADYTEFSETSTPLKYSGLPLTLKLKSIYSTGKGVYQCFAEVNRVE